MRRQRVSEDFFYPELGDAEFISLDIETRDPELIEMGPGALRDPLKNYITGISVATPDRQSWYLPMLHANGRNYPVERVMQWAKDQLCRPNQPKLGANLLYDTFWLHANGVPVSGPYWDVQIAEPLLNENRDSYSLETLGQHYCGVGKTEDKISEWVSQHVKKNPSGKEVKKNLWKVPAELVAEYAKQDALLPIDIFEKQKQLLKEQDLWDLFELETDLLPVLLGIKLRGMRVDVGRAKEVEQEYGNLIDVAKTELDKLVGFDVNVNKAPDLIRICTQLNVKHMLTDKKNPSFTSKWFDAQGFREFDLVSSLRSYGTFKGTFVQGTILKYAIDGRIHGDYNPLRSDDYGTVSGRLSASKPNLQNQESKDPVRGPLLRSLFLPEPEEHFYKFDYKAIEPRIALHYAGPEANAARKFLCNNPDADVYQIMIDAIPELDRKTIKGIYLGLGYGMGIDKLATILRTDAENAKKQKAIFNEALPYVKNLSKRAAERAASNGVIRTLLGRTCRFNTHYETSKPKYPSDFAKKEEYYRWRAANAPTKDMAEARAKWGANIKPGYTYKAFNRLCQGGSADILKKAMVDLHKAGVYDQVGFPVNNVHDEIDMSIPATEQGDGIAKEVARIMQSTVELRVPLRVDVERGPNWGSVKEVTFG